MKLNAEIRAKACAQARGLAIDAVHQAASGHLGLPLGATEIGAVPYGHALLPDRARAGARARGLAIAAVHQAGSGHLGLPLGATEIGAVLYGHALVHDPDEP